MKYTQCLKDLSCLVASTQGLSLAHLANHPGLQNNWSPRVMWRLYSGSGTDKDYEEFRIPFITVVNKVYDKIRNLTYRYMPNQMTLFPKETKQYDAKLLQELLNNCIAHQDYTAGRRIYLDEFEDTVVISNAGTFLPGDIREVLKTGYTAPYYLNQLLADAMMNFNMIDTKQMGIRMVFNIQRQRYFPMPDYDLSKPKEVAARVYGKVFDENYTRLLFGRDDLGMETIFLFDCVQKRISLETEQYKQLQKLGVIEGRRPNVFVSAGIADIVDERAQYIKEQGDGRQLLYATDNLICVSTSGVEKAISLSCCPTSSPMFLTRSRKRTR
jgi:ATP-dependent DNA helicase RecG